MEAGDIFYMSLQSRVFKAFKFWNMIYDNEGDLNYDAWYSSNKDDLPEPLGNLMADNFDKFHFLCNVHQKVMKNLAPALRKLMLKQYPVFRTEKRKLVVQKINSVLTTTGHLLLLNLYHLVQGQKAGENVRETYPDFDTWVGYARTESPNLIDENKRSQYTWLSDEEWEVYRDNENKDILQFFTWQEKRKFEFIDLVQKLLFKYFKELEDLNADEWIIYAVYIREEYEAYLFGCEEIERFIDCGFPEELVNQTYEEFLERFMNLSCEITDKRSELRSRRIAGEII